MVYAALMISLYTMSHYNGLCCLNDIFVYHESLQWFMLCLNDIFIYHKPLQWVTIVDQTKYLFTKKQL